MATVAELIATRPSPSHGVPIGLTFPRLTSTRTPEVIEAKKQTTSISRSPSITFTLDEPGDLIIFFTSSNVTGKDITVSNPWVNILGGNTDVESDAHQACFIYRWVTTADHLYVATNLYDVSSTHTTIALLIRYADETTPINAVATNFDTATTATHIIPAVTPTIAGGLIVGALTSDSDISEPAHTTPAGWTRELYTGAGSQSKTVYTYDTASEFGVTVGPTNTTALSGDEYIGIAIVVAPGGVPWRLAVEALVPASPTSVWGLGTWDESTWTDIDWVDLTAYVRGMEWFAGADDFEARPSVGPATITLDNELGLFNPLDPSTALLGLVGLDADATPSNQVFSYYFGPGTIFRIVAHIDYSDAATPSDSDYFVTLYTGIVESWTLTDSYMRADSYVEVTLKQTLGLLARVNDNALGSPVGDNDTFSQRADRIADSVSWAFGITDATVTTDSIALQSTDFALNRLAELYLAADSVGGVARSAKNGSILLYDNYGDDGHAPQSTSYTFIGASTGDDGSDTYIQVDPTEIVIANDDVPIVSSVSFARIGGSVQTAEDVVLIQRYGLIIDQNRNDLINKSDVTTLALAESLLARRSIPVHIESITINALADNRAYAALIDIDVHNRVTVCIELSSGACIEFQDIRIDSMTHQITPKDRVSLNWTCQLTFGALDNLPVYHQNGL